MISLKDKWYGVLLVNGVMKVKRYTGDEDMENETLNPNVDEVTEVVVARTQDEAHRKCFNLFRIQ